MNAVTHLEPAPPFTVFPATVIPVGGDTAPDDGPVALKVAQPPTALVELPATAKGTPHRNGHRRKSERSHAHDHWHFAKVPKSHLPADVSQQWWTETKAMIDRGYDRFIARRHLDRHAPEWSISNWGVCAGVHFDPKP